MRVRRFSLPLFVGVLIGLPAAGQPPATGTGTSSSDAPKPPTAAVIPEKAVEYFRKKDYAAAYEELKKAAKGHAAAPHPRVQLSLMFFDSGDVQNARAMLEAAAMEDPEHPDVYLTNASFAYREGRVTDAVLNLTAALNYAQNPRWNADQRSRFSRDAHLGLAACFESRQDWASAKEQITALSNADKKNTVYLQRLGVVLFNLGKATDALAAFAQAYKDDPTIDPPELRMGMLWFQKNDPAQTEEFLKKAIALYPKDARCHRGYAEFFLNNGKLSDADSHLKAAENIAQTARDTLYVRGLYFRYMRNFSEAEKIFDELSRKYPADILVSVQLALCLAESTDKVKQQRGVDMAELVVRQAPQNAEGYAVLGWCLYKIGRLDDAEKALAKSINTSGGRLALDTAFYFSQLLADRGKDEEAYKNLKATLAESGPFVNRSEAKKLFDELDKKLPKEKKEDKKEDKKDEKKR